MSSPTILVIEDSISDVFLIRYALDQQDEAYLLEVLPDGAAALMFVAEHRSGIRQHDPCVILLDLHLPKYNGIEVLKAIKTRTGPDPHSCDGVNFNGQPPRPCSSDCGAIYREMPSQIDEFSTLGREILTLCKGPIPL